MAHVTSLKLRSFKSVGAEWIHVPFGPGLCAIVGPNGCGKSSLLDAVLFACAAPLKTFGVGSLSDLANSDSMGVCEVIVQLRRGTEAHRVGAALTPDGGRTFKVNGRNKSGREVRDFLRSLGVSLEGGAAVIRQARVTALADSAGPAELAALVAEASGLGRWNEEVAAASEEVKRTRKALGEVQAGLGTLELSVAASEAQLAAVERLEALDHEAAELAQRMAGLLQEALARCCAETAAGKSAAEAVAGAAKAAQGRVAACQAELAAVQRVLEQRQQQQQEQHAAGSLSGGAGSLLSLQQQVAEAEEEVRLAEEEAGRQQRLQAELEAAAAEVARLDAARASAAAELAACQQAQRRVAADLHLTESSASTAALRASVAGEERRLAAAVAAQQQAAAAAVGLAEELASRLAELQGEQQRLAGLTAQAAAAGSSSSAEMQQEQAVLRVQAAQQHARLQALQQQEQRAVGEAGMLAARLSAATGGASASASAAWRPLHQCFTFRDPQHSGQYAEALSVLAGRKLGVVVADSLEAAGQLLSSSASRGGARIWPLDSLSVADHSEQQRRAAAAFPEGQVVLPVDLLAFHPAHRPAVLRAFGSHVIAASDAVAEQLISRFGVPSITPGGRLTSRGTLQGGWRGEGGGRQPGPVHLKLGLAAAEQHLAAVRQEAAAAQAALAGSRHQLAQQEVQQEAAAAAAAELAAAERDVSACHRRLASQQAAQTDAQASLSRLQAELAAKQSLLASLPDGDVAGGGGSSGGGRAKAALQMEQQRLDAAAAALERAVEVTAAQLAAASACQADLEDELALLGQEGLEGGFGGGASEDGGCSGTTEGQVEAAQAALTAATAALQARQAELAAQAEALAAHEGEHAQAANTVAAAEQALAEAEGRAAALEASAAVRVEEQRELQQQLDQLLAEVPELAAVLQAGGGIGDGGAASNGTGSPPGSVAALRKSVAALGRQRGRLVDERRRSSASRLPLAEVLRFREQKGALGAAREQAGTLGTAAQRLQEGIHASSGQVLSAHEAVFRAIAATFASLTAAVLPAYRVRLRKAGREVHEGLVLEFAPHRAAGAGKRPGGGDSTGEEGEEEEEEEEEENSSSGSGSPGGSKGGGWRRGLDALSGGQRTMVSLALVVAAAMSGGGTSLLLMDEVDAALDEANQQLVARLFGTLSAAAGKASGAGSGSRPACAQVLAVSHSPTFQQLCRHVVRLTRGQQGTTLAAEGGGQGGAKGGVGAVGAAGLAAVQAGRGKKARKK